jgi:hypothetical protein
VFLEGAAYALAGHADAAARLPGEIGRQTPPSGGLPIRLMVNEIDRQVRLD